MFSSEMLNDYGNISTILSFVFGGSGLFLLGRYKNKPKVCKNLYTLLKAHIGQVTNPILKPVINPFEEIIKNPNRALIIQGPNKIGKTCMFGLSIPWYRMYGPLSYKGMVINGASCGYYETYTQWKTMEIENSILHSHVTFYHKLQDYRNGQWFRILMNKIFDNYKPKRAFIIVNQYEELLKKFPTDALGFANNLANDQVRNEFAYVFFVVNTENASKAIVNLNQGERFRVVVLDKSADKLPNASEIENERFKLCSNNIGLYKECKGIDIKDLTTKVNEKLELWKKQYHVPYSPNRDYSWRKVDEKIIRKILLKKIRESLKSRKVINENNIEVQLLSDDEINIRCEIMSNIFKSLSKDDIIQRSVDEWLSGMKSECNDLAVAEELTNTIMTILSTPYELNNESNN